MNKAIDDVLDALEALIASGQDFSDDTSLKADAETKASDAADAIATLSMQQRARLARIVAVRPEIAEWLVAGFAAQSVALRFAEARLSGNQPDAWEHRPPDDATLTGGVEPTDEQGQRGGFLGWLLGPPPPNAARHAKADSGSVPAFEPMGAESREIEIAGTKPDPHLQAGFRMAYAIGGGAILSYFLAQEGTGTSSLDDGDGDSGPVSDEGDLHATLKHDGTSDSGENSAAPDDGFDGDYH